MNDILNIAINNKDIFTTIITIGIIFFWMIPLFKYFIKQVLKEINKWFIIVSLWVWKNAVTNSEDIVELVKAFLSMSKSPILTFLRKRLIENNLDKNKELIKKEIWNKIISLNKNIYIRWLNRYNTHCWLLGNLVGDMFDMNSFLKDIYEVIFNKDFDQNRKLDIIRETVIPKYVDALCDDIRLQLNNNQNV